MQIGVAMDWWHRSENQEVALGTYEGPGGSGESRLVLSQSTRDLVPILAFVQVSGDENMSVIPYGGFGVGYEWLFLTSDDYVANESFDQTFGGFGWQVWGGAGHPPQRPHAPERRGLLQRLRGRQRRGRLPRRVRARHRARRRGDERRRRADRPGLGILSTSGSPFVRPGASPRPGGAFAVRESPGLVSPHHAAKVAAFPPPRARAAPAGQEPPARHARAQVGQARRRRASPRWRTRVAAHAPTNWPRGPRPCAPSSSGSTPTPPRRSSTRTRCSCWSPPSSRRSAPTRA